MTARHYSQAEIDAVLALDEKRTPGDWHVDESTPDEPVVLASGQYICQTIYDHQSYTYRADPEGHVADAQFIAAAPKMVAIVRQQQEEIARLNELLDIAHHNLQEEQRRSIKRDSRIALLEGEIKGLTRPLGTGKAEEVSNAR